MNQIITSPISTMATILFKVNDKIPKELDIIQEEEGLGNRTATITFLIKYYFLTKKTSLSQTLQMMDLLMEHTHFKKSPSPRKQLEDI
jgi:hypothetical protein